MTLLSLVYGVGPRVASLAVEAGAPMRVAFALRTKMVLDFATEAEEFCSSIGINPCPKGDGTGIFCLGALQPTNWEGLAEIAGERIDIQAWQDWAHAREQA